MTTQATPTQAMLRNLLGLTSTVVVLAPSVYLLMYLAFGSTFMFPGGLGFTLWVGYVCAFVGASLVSLLGVAPLVGMIFAGVILRNSGAVTGVSPSIVSSEIRTCAVAIILARAGIGLSFKALREQQAAILIHGLLPSFTGALMATLLGYLVFNFSVLWSFAFGFGLASTSPAVIAPLTLAMREKGYGNVDNLATVLLGALPLDIMVGVVGNSVFLGTIFSSDKTLVYAHAPIELGSGVVGGLGLGFMAYMLAKVPAKAGQEQSILFWFLIITSFSVALGTKLVGYTGAGAMANMMMWVGVANFFPEEEAAHYANTLKIIWLIIEPAFFSVIGMTLSFNLVSGQTIAQAVGIILAVEFVRLFATFGGMKLAGKPTKDAIYVAGKWSAKATIQAALATAALDSAKAAGSDPVQIATGTTILVTYLLAILMMAPTAAFWSAFTMTKLLKSDKEHLEQLREQFSPSFEEKGIITP